MHFFKVTLLLQLINIGKQLTTHLYSIYYENSIYINLSSRECGLATFNCNLMRAISSNFPERTVYYREVLL
jgi:hypothetical protein